MPEVIGNGKPVNDVYNDNDDNEGLTIRRFRAMAHRTPSFAADRIPGTRRWRQPAGDYTDACTS
jgi:hypothetical protein